VICAVVSHGTIRKCQRSRTTRLSITFRTTSAMAWTSAHDPTQLMRSGVVPISARSSDYIPLVSMVMTSVPNAKIKRPREMSSFLGIIST
jgi:hypothetical protein